MVWYNLDLVVKPSSVRQIERRVAKCREMMWIELRATDVIVDHDTENFKGFGHQLRAEEGSVIFNEFLFIYIFIAFYNVAIHLGCFLSHQASS